jgi:hypothetical protein
MTDRFPYWRKQDEVQNFGDYLTELYLADIFEPAAPPFSHVHLVGSMISAWWIRQLLDERGAGSDQPIAFWCCGVRDATPIDPALLAHCRFFGIRGPDSRALLGLPAETPLGDSALLLPLLHEPATVKRYAGQSICIPHIADKSTETALLAMSGADAVVRPAIPKSLDNLREMIDVIAGAEFVLAGALHAAICACAFGVPFCFFDSGFIDLPFKWRDFAASVQIPTVFVREVEVGRRAWRSVLSPAMRRPALAALLETAPLPVRPPVLSRARELDARTRG